LCLTRSSSSSSSSCVQPRSISPSGKMAYCALFSVALVGPGRVWSIGSCGRSDLGPPSFSSLSTFRLAICLSLFFSLSIVRASPSLSESLYAGWRSINLPREGTKREFWTLVSVERVATSGSSRSQLIEVRPGTQYMPTTSSRSTVSVSYSWSPVS
jgi:hypothetical protein